MVFLSILIANRTLQRSSPLRACSKSHVELKFSYFRTKIFWNWGRISRYFDEISTICSRNYEISADKPVFSYTGGEILNRLLYNSSD